MIEKLIIIQFDYSGENNLYSYKEVLNSIEKDEYIIYTTCLDFFSFSSLDKGYDVKVIKRSGDYILLSELLIEGNGYTNKNIRKAHNVHRMLLANAFSFKTK